MVKGKHVQHVHSEVESDGSRLLGLDGLTVERVDRDAFGGRLVHVETADESASACPTCGVFSSSVKGARDHSAARRPLRDSTVAAGVAQAQVALRASVVPTRVVHRVVAGGPCAEAADDAAAGRARARSGRTAENDNPIWPHCAALIWPHPLAADVLLGP